MAFFGLNVVSTYIFTKQSMPMYFSEPPTEGEMPMLTYMGKVVGQNQMAALMMCVISVASGVVTKQFMLVLTIFLAFLIGDIARVISWKETLKLDASKLYP